MVKLIRVGCNCIPRLWEFCANTEGAYNWGPGTMLECDCGKQYVMSNDKPGGHVSWSEVVMMQSVPTDVDWPK